MVQTIAELFGLLLLHIFEHSLMLMLDGDNFVRHVLLQLLNLASESARRHVDKVAHIVIERLITAQIN